MGNAIVLGKDSFLPQKLKLTYKMKDEVIRYKIGVYRLGNRGDSFRRGNFSFYKV